MVERSRQAGVGDGLEDGGARGLDERGADGRGRGTELVLVESMLTDVLDDGAWDEVLDRHALADEQADLGGRDIVPDQLGDQIDPVPVHRQWGLGVHGIGELTLVYFRLGSFDDVASELSEDVMEIMFGP